MSIKSGDYTVDLHMLASELFQAGRAKESKMLIEVSQRLVQLENLAQSLESEMEKIRNLTGRTL